MKKTEPLPNEFKVSYSKSSRYRKKSLCRREIEILFMSGWNAHLEGRKRSYCDLKLKHLRWWWMLGWCEHRRHATNERRRERYMEKKIERAN